MKKITVKRFLNKRVKPIMVWDDIEELGYPLYYSITYDRKTQNIKSLNGAIMTQKAFEYLNEKNEIFYREINYLKGFMPYDLIEELEYIKKAVYFIVEDRGLKNIFNKEFTNVLKNYFNELEDALFYIGWLKYDHLQRNFLHLKKERTRKKPIKPLTVADILKMKIKQTPDEVRMEKLYNGSYNEMEQFYYSFNKERNLLVSINRIKKITGQDLTPFFYEDTIKYWYVINLVLRSYNDRALKIDFLLDFDPSKYIATNKELGYPLSDEEIILISKELRYKALLF
ncbi:hypothetical protein PG637_08185 [Riemerella anatipestifer]|nr:hypothetical protein [Riemerella anatipestifer]MDY3325641.1 hypothetical protein [Riemerella anatipestifer]MDY3353956.1 hypothetical protein [Riemerella anatipestifer]